MGDLQEIKGVGNTVESQLGDHGITTANQLANCSLEELEEIGIRNAETILNRAQKLGVPIDSGEDVLEEQDNIRHVPTGLEPLDEVLGGGFQGGYLIGVSGEPKVGKTQFVFQTLASAVDYTDGHAVYIETEPNRFHINRVRSLSREEESYKRVHRIKTHTEDEDTDNLRLQRNAYGAIKDNFTDVSMVAVDSFQANFRLSGRYESRADLPARNSAIADHLRGLQSLASTFDCPVLMTLQVMGNPDNYSAGTSSIWGSVLMDHTIAYLMYLSHAKGELKEVEMKGHPGLPDDSVLLKIPEDAPLEAME